MTSHPLQSTVTIFLNQGHLKAGTRKAYAQILEKLTKYIGPDRPLIDIEPLELQKFWGRISQQRYSPHTLNKHLRSLKAFFNWCVDNHLIELSPANGLKRPRIPRHIPKNKAMTEDEYQTLLTFARQTSARNYALLLFIGDTGCRAIAASRLRRQDVNLDDCTAFIKGKGDRYRTVYFGKQCQRALRDWLRLKPINTGLYVFRERVNNDGDKGPIKPDNISQTIRRMCEKAGLERSLGSHSLRHRKGHQLADSKTPITVAAKALGHANSQTTQGYFPDDDERVRRKMEELSTGAGDDQQTIPKRSPKIIPLKHHRK